MKKSLIALVTVLTISNAFAFPGGKEGKIDRDPKMDHALTVGNAKAAASGTNAEDKTVRQHKMHSHKGKAKGHDK